MNSIVFAFSIIRTAIAPLWVRGPFRLSRTRVPRRPEQLPLEFVRRNTCAKTRSEGARRRSVPLYADDVLREGIVNAVAHRDYLLTETDIEMAVYSDGLEIVSPGYLQNGMTPERMRAGARSHRNPLLMHVMRDYGCCESMGMGVRKKIIPGMNEHNKTEPDLIEDHERFILRLLAMPPSVAQADS